MGYTTKPIATVTEPKEIALVGQPNFFQVARNPIVLILPFNFNLTVNIGNGESNIKTKTEIRFTDVSNVTRTYYGTTVAAEVGGNVFFVSSDKSETAENLRQALENSSWFNTNYVSFIPFDWSSGLPVNGRTISIKSKRAWAGLNLTITAPGNTANVAYTLALISNSTNTDSLSGGNLTTEIQLDVYADPVTFYGKNPRFDTVDSGGTFIISLQKSYADNPLWFDLNAIFRQYGRYKIPGFYPGWYDTGTLRAFRFVAKKIDTNSTSFYQSSALYTLNGYGNVTDPVDVSEYNNSHGIAKQLTNMPRATYYRGQRAYFNFLNRDPFRDVTGAPDWQYQVLYRAFSQSGQYLGASYRHPKFRNQMFEVNTCVLEIDAVITMFPTAGKIGVALAQGAAIASNEIFYEVLPECLHKLKYFSFLNRLGGWDAFNFDATITEDIDLTSDKYNKTVTPSTVKGSSVETVYATQLAITRTIVSAPMTNDIAEWLYELAASKVIIDDEGNYIVIDEFTLKNSEATDNLQVATIKYHLTDSYTND